MKKQEKVAQNILDQFNYWSEYPDRDVEFVRWYPCDINYLTSKQVFAEHHRDKFNDRASFYIHIPFCNNPCTSCPYNKFNTRSGNLVDRYLEALKNEITTYSKSTYLKGKKFISGYIGGGTPTSLQANHLRELLKHIRENLDIDNDCCITIETTPIDINPEKVSVLLENGVNRISIGVQTFQDDLIRYIGRAKSHTRSKSIESINMIKREGMDYINIDFMYGIPGQTIESWDEDIRLMMELPLTSVSAMLYLVLPGSQTFYKIQNRQIPSCPSSKEQDQMYWRFTERLLSNNYLALTNYDYFGGPSLRNRPDQNLKTYSIKNQRNNNIYKGLDTSSSPSTHYLDHQWSKGIDRFALGPGAYGDINHHLYLNEPNIEKYISICNSGVESISAGSFLNKQERMCKSMVLGAKLLRIKRSDFKEIHGIDFYEVFKSQIDDLVEKELVILTEEALQVTYPKGLFYINNISKAFYSKSQYRLPQPDSASTDYLIWTQK